MKAIQDLLRRKEFYLFLFLISMILFNWPFLSIVAEKQTHVLFFYIFWVWAIIIFLSYLIARSHQTKASEGGEDNTEAQEHER